MIDIHSHILPGLDDGPKELNEALDMARGAVADGITTMLATPHQIEGVYHFPRAHILEKVQEFRAQLKAKGIPLQILPGCEAFLEPNLIEYLKEGYITTLNDTGKYLLVEFPIYALPIYSTEIILQICLLGITPIIAHPERNSAICQKPQILYEFISQGALIQVNGSSLIGYFGSTAAVMAEVFLKLNWVHFLASDAHSSGTRAAVLAQAAAKAEQLIGPKAQPLVFDNPLKVIKGEKIFSGPPLEYRKLTNNFWNRLKKLF